jgi:hypothetical protein
MGGNPQYVSPAARAVAGTDSKLLEATFLLAGSADVMTQEMVMLDAALIAEAAAQANWAGIAELAGQLPEGDLRGSFFDAVADVGPEKNQHLMWTREAKSKMVTLQASSTALATAGAKLEEVTATIRGWFS